MNRRLPFSLVLIALVATSPALACLHGPESYEGSLGQDAQEAIVFWSKGQQELVVRLRYALSSGDSVGSLAWVVPVPAAPDAYGTVDPQVFADLHDAWEHDNDLRRDARGRVVWTKPKRRGGGITFSDGGEEGVELLTQVSVGAYDVQPIRATGAQGAKAVNVWLSKNGFGQVPLANMQHYVDRGWVWLAVKINPARAGGSMGKEGTLRPLRISFKSERIVYPLKFSTHQGEFDVRLWVVTDGPLREDRRALRARYPTPEDDLELEAAQRWLPLPASVDAVQTQAKGFTALDNRVGVKVPRVTRVRFSIKGEAIALWSQDFSFAAPLPAPKRVGAAPFAPRGLDPATRIRRAQAKIPSYGGGLSFGDGVGAGEALLALDEIPAAFERPRDLFARAKLLAAQGDDARAERLLAEALRRAPDGAPSAARFRLERLLAGGRVKTALALIDRLARRDRYARNRYARSLIQILTRLGRYAEAYERADAIRGRVMRKGKLIRRYRPTWTQTALQALVRDEAKGIAAVAHTATTEAGQKRRDALNLLGWLGPRAAAHLPLVLRAVGAKRERFRLVAAVAADRIAPRDPRLFESLWAGFTAIDAAEEWEDETFETETTLALLLAKHPTKALERLGARWSQRKGRSFLMATALARLGQPAVPLLRSALLGADTNVARNTLSALGRFPAAAVLLVPELTRLVEGDHPLLQARAAAVLARVGTAASPALPALLRALQSADAEVRLRASIALGRIEGATPHLIELLAKPRVAASAALALIRVGRSAVPALQAALPQARNKPLLVWTLGQVGPAAVRALIAAAQDRDATVQATALWALAERGLAAAPAQALGVALLSGEAEGPRSLAAELLAQLPSAAAALSRAAADPRPTVRAAALRALARHASPDDEAAEEARLGLFLKGIADADPQVRGAAGSAFLETGIGEPKLLALIATAPAPVKVSVLDAVAAASRGVLEEDQGKLVVGALADRAVEVRRAAIRVIRRHELWGAAWVPALAKLAASDPDAGVRLAAIRGLEGDVDLEGVRRQLAQALGDERAAVRRVAARLVGKAGGDDVALTLLPRLVDADREVRRIAAAQLGECGGEHEQKLEPALLRLLAAKEPDLQFAALKGLSGITWSPAGKRAVVRVLGSPFVVLRRTAAEGLVFALDAQDALHAPTLIASLADADVGVRLALVRCLAKLGKAKGVEGALERATKDDHRRVRRAAQGALAKIRMR